MAFLFFASTTTTYYMLDRNLGASNNGYYAPDVVALAKNKKAIGGYFCLSEKKRTSDATQDLSSTLSLIHISDEELTYPPYYTWTTEFKDTEGNVKERTAHAALMFSRLI